MHGLAAKVPGGLRLAWRAAVGFARDTAGAVGVASVLLTAMCLAGTAFVSDHVVLLHQRDVLQAAAGAASIATTRQMGKLPDDLTVEQLTAQLEPMARRYVLANLPEERRELARRTLELAVTPDREAGVVGVDASADLGGAIVGRHIWGSLIEKTSVVSGGERVVVPVDVVLAIDVTGSMRSSINAGGAASTETRMDVVREAAETLIKGLYDQGGETGYVAVGLVPFNTTVNIGAGRTDWVRDLGEGHKVIPERFGPWRGCVEHRAMEGDLDLSLVTPDVTPFTSWFWPNSLEFRKAERDAIAAEVGETVRGDNDWPSEEEGTEETVEDRSREYGKGPHYGCPLDEIVPLNHGRAAVEQAVAALRPWTGGGTMTHLGVVWGRRLLAAEWRTSWGLAADRAEAGRQRVLVLLTDGVNDAYDSRRTYPGNYKHGDYWRAEYSSHYTGYGRAGTGTVAEGYRSGTRLSGLTSDAEDRNTLNTIFLDACDLAKADGITVFTVSAVPTGHPKEAELAQRLTDCATSADHAFVRNSEPDTMKAAFRQIGRMVAGYRRSS